MTIKIRVSKESIKEINDLFTDSYQFKHWFFKIKTYDLILENTEKFVEEFGDKELKIENIEAYRLTLKSEVVFTFFHMSEALFSLMYCSTYSKVPWLDMKKIRFKDLCIYIKDKIVSGKVSDGDLRFIFFNGVIGEDAKKEPIVDSIKFIREFLIRTGTLFLDNDIYNEYKHGLRLMSTLSNLKFTPDNSQKPIMDQSGTAHIFLTTKLISKKGKDEVHRIQKNVVSFDYQLYLRLCIKIYQLFDAIFITRRQMKRLNPGDLMKVVLFDHEDLDETFKEDPSAYFSFAMDYQ